jgi:hypothetical protein
MPCVVQHCTVFVFVLAWLAVQNITISQVRNLFSVIAVFISFPAAFQTGRHGRKA